MAAVREQPDMFRSLAVAPEIKGAVLPVKPQPDAGSAVVKKRLVLRMEKRGLCAFSPGADPHCVWVWLPAAEIKIENLEPTVPQWCDVTMPLALATEKGIT